MQQPIRRALLGVSALAIGAATGGIALADPVVPYAIPLPIQNPNFTSFSGTGNNTPKNYFTSVNPTGWFTTRPLNTSQPDLTAIDGPGTSTYFGHFANGNNQPYGIYPTHTVNNVLLPNYIDPGPPSGGNYLQMDGNQVFATIVQQTITNLTIGQQYYIGFYQASGQQNGTSFTLATTDYWRVFLGEPISVNCRNLLPDGSCPVTTFGQTQEWDSPTMHNPAQGSTPWTYVQSNLTANGNNAPVTFTAYATTETLSYFAFGTNQGANQPPTLFLSGFNDVHTAAEPVTLTLFGVGLGGLAAGRRWRRTQKPKGEPRTV